MSNQVFHITSTLKLPWIIESGRLRPFTNHLPGVGAITYLWATSNRAGDKTAAGARVAEAREDAWRDDLFRLVRLTLPADGFFTWDEVIKRENYTDTAVATLHEYDRRKFGEFGQHLWRCRKEPLSLSQVIKAEAKTFRGSWRRISLDQGCLVRTADTECLGYRIGRGVHYSVRYLESDDPTIYGHRTLYLDSDELADRYTVERLDNLDDDGDGA